MAHEIPEGSLTLALIGAGKAGRLLAAAAVRAGHRVVLEDVLPSRLREALDEIPTEGMPGSLETVTTVEDAVREADLAIDFVPDELESKLEIVCMVDRMAPPKTILCIQTRALSVSDLANCTYRADRCVGAWFGADETLITKGPQTSSATADRVAAFFRSVTPQVDVVEEAVAAASVSPAAASRAQTNAVATAKTFSDCSTGPWGVASCHACAVHCHAGAESCHAAQMQPKWKPSKQEVQQVCGSWQNPCLPGRRAVASRSGSLQLPPWRCPIAVQSGLAYTARRRRNLKPAKLRCRLKHFLCRTHIGCASASQVSAFELYPHKQKLPGNHSPAAFFA